MKPGHTPPGKFLRRLVDNSSRSWYDYLMMNKAIAIAAIAITATAGAATAQAAGSHTAYEDWSECSIEVPAGADYRDGLWYSAEGKVIAAAEEEDECVDFLGPQSSADEIMVVTLRWLASSVG